VVGMAWNENRSLNQEQTGDQKGEGEGDERDESAEITVGKAHLRA
jgi:hypothetical protein